MPAQKRRGRVSLPVTMPPDPEFKMPTQGAMRILDRFEKAADQLVIEEMIEFCYTFVGIPMAAPEKARFGAMVIALWEAVMMKATNDTKDFIFNEIVSHDAHLEQLATELVQMMRRYLPR